MRHWNNVPLSPLFFTRIKGEFAANFSHILSTRNQEIFFVGETKHGWAKRTFSEFFDDIQRTCAWFEAKNADQNTNVVTAAKNTYEHLVVMAAALFSGRTLCPLDPSDASERIKRKLEQIGEQFIGFSDQAHILEIPEFSPDPILESKSTFSPTPFPKGRPAVRVFTSGTTGYSKIVEQTESGILANVEAVVEHHRLFAPTVIGTPLPVFHVNALEFSFLGALFSGNKLVLFSEFQPDRMLATAAEEKVNILSVVPHILRALQSRNLWDQHDLSSLRYFLTAAAPLSIELARALSSNVRVPLVQGYGLSEAVNFSTTMPIDLPEQELRHWLTAHERPSIGVPLKGNEISIVSATGEVLGEGEKGEICISGYGLMDGYKDTDNSSVFRGGVLHTGDLGFFRYDTARENKYFFICGRIKDTIKRYGQTVSLAEVDDILSQIDSACISVGFHHETSGEELAAVVRRPWSRGSMDHLVEEINKNFSENIRPKILLFTEDEVRTPSGKSLRWKFTPLLAKWSTAPLGRKCIGVPPESP